MRSFMDIDRSLKELVEYLESQGYIKTEKVKNAFLDVPRDIFIKDVFPGKAYMDTPLPIGNGQTISAPHMVAIMAEELRPCSGHRVLEIGGGSGYHAAIVGRMVGPEGHVISLERFEVLVKKARNALASIGIENVTMIHGDGSEGYPEHGPYDRIYYTCAAPYVPKEVFDQLKVGGILLSVEGEPYSTQRLIRYFKVGDSQIEKEMLTLCVFVPLIGKYGHRS